MANESIALSQKFDVDKLVFPVFLSEKLDGVPVRLKAEYMQGTVQWRAYTRSWEVAVSVSEDMNRFIQANVKYMVPGFEYNWVFEVTHQTVKGFKNISGLVRRQYVTSGFKYNLFDYDAFHTTKNSSGIAFEQRIRIASEFQYPHGFHMIAQIPYDDMGALVDAASLERCDADQEGWVIRSAFAPFKPGTRHWDYQKVVKEPLIDLLIVRAEEGVGKFAGGVGRFVAQYKGVEIGIGPGKQTTAERAAALKAVYPRCATIKYKPDDDYEALRQPTFQYWRDDKHTGDA